MKQDMKLILMATCVSILFPCSVFAERLTDKEKKEYKDEGSYVQIFENPKDSLRKKLVLGAVFLGITLKVEKPYDELLPNYGVVNIENSKAIPFMFSAKNEDLRKALSELPPGRLVKYFGVLNSKTKVSKKPGAGNADSEKFFYFEVLDVESVSAEKEQEKLNVKFNESDFKEVEYRRIDIQYPKFMDKKVKFNISFRDIDNKLPQDLVKLLGISEETHFQLLATEPFHTIIVVQRENEESVNTLVNIKAGEKIAVYGTLKSVCDPSMKKDRPLFYIDASMIRKANELAKDN